MGALNVSSQEDADRLQRRLRVLSDRLEETEDRLDRAMDDIRALKRQVSDLKDETPTRSSPKKQTATKARSGGTGSSTKKP